MTTTDPTITIAGLRAQIESLETSLRGSLDDVAAGEEVRLISEAEHAAVAAERTALAAQLAGARAELARLQAADLSRDAAESVGADQIAILRADLASERAHLAACRTRIAGLEAAANKHRAEIDAAVGQLASARQVTDERTAERDRLTARVAEFEARPVLVERFTEAYIKAINAAPFAARLAKKYDDRRALMDQHGDTPSGCMQRALISTAISMGIDPFAPTSQPAPPEVFAGVSEDELIRLFYVVRMDGIDHGEQCPPIDSSDRAGIRAVLGRLKTTLVAPVDPEAVARAYHDCEAGPVSSVVPYWRAMGGDHALSVTAMRAALTAAGVPVTPERGK